MLTKQDQKMIDDIVSRVERILERETAAELAELRKVDRSNVPDFYTGARHRGNVVTSSPLDGFYRSLPEAERQWRTPDADHWGATWIRAELAKDAGKMWEAEERLAKLFGRATTEEGTVGADGAFSTGTGGSLIPRPIAQLVYIARDRVAKMRRFATIVPMTAQQHTVPTAASMTAYMTLEGATATQGEPTISSVPLVACKAQVHAIATREQIDDSAVSVVNLYTTRAGMALGALEDSEFFRLGTGTQPHVTKLSGTAYAETTSGYLDFTSVSGMVRTLGQQYRQSAVWFINSDVLELLTLVRDGSGRQFYVGLSDQPGSIGDDPTSEGTLMRRPVYEVDMTSGDIWFGDPRACYAIGDREGLRVESSSHRLFNEDKVEFKFTARIAGNNVDTAAAQYATGITSANSL
jgi:HK97 family phage major capsid protein